MIKFAEPESESLVDAIVQAIPLVRYIKPSDFHAELKEMYNWPDVAERTVIVYDSIMASPPVPLIERFRRFFGVGRIYGPIAVIIMAIFHFMVCALEMVAPASEVDIVPDVPLHLIEEIETSESLRCEAAAVSRPNVSHPTPLSPATSGGGSGTVSADLAKWTLPGMRSTHKQRKALVLEVQQQQQIAKGATGHLPHSPVPIPRFLSDNTLRLPSTLADRTTSISSTNSSLSSQPPSPLGPHAYTTSLRIRTRVETAANGTIQATPTAVDTDDPTDGDAEYFASFPGMRLKTPMFLPSSSPLARAGGTGINATPLSLAALSSTPMSEANSGTPSNYSMGITPLNQRGKGERRG